MTQGTTGSAAPTRTATKPLKTTDLPIRIPLIHGETNASFLLRTAAANHLPLPRLLKALHRGRASGLDKADVQPNLQELRLSPEALARLAALVERDEDQLRRALPGLHPEQLLKTVGPTVRITDWPDGLGIPPLKACPLCLEDDAWLVAHGHRWRPCDCARRWQCGDDGGYLIDTTSLPEIGRALMEHRAFDHRIGPAGDALVADAHQVVLWWWVNRQVAHEIWRRREDELGFGRHRRRAAPAAVYPEALRLANAMEEWETRRTTPEASPHEWLADVAASFETPGIVGGREGEPLWHWLELHPAFSAGATTRSTKTAERRWNQLPALHHRPDDRGPFHAKSCLRWVYGLPLTSTTELCPHCNGHALSCRWVASPDCPQRPAEDVRP
ncbi:TniQ family protein [Streptomyces sp. NPDC001205]